jgi:hypothetical protein
MSIQMQKNDPAYKARVHELSNEAGVWLADKCSNPNNPDHVEINLMSDVVGLCLLKAIRNLVEFAADGIARGYLLELIIEAEPLAFGIVSGRESEKGE